MGAISLQGVTVQFGSQIVLDNISLDAHTGETVGVVGPNGAGKTTLFRVIAQLVKPDIGTITSSRGLSVGYLPQEPDLDSNKTLHDEAATAFEHLHALEAKLHELSDAMAQQHASAEAAALMAEYDRVNARFLAAGGYACTQRLGEVLGGLGFVETDWTLPIGALSGGQRCRVALAKLLLAERQFLLLDEPTNHLDIDAVRWLERFLAGHHGGAMIISHDRYLLDRLADRIIEVDRTGVQSFPGNYSNYVETKARRGLTQERQAEKDAAYIAKERTFIEKNIYGQRSREAQGRRKRLERQMAAGAFETEVPKAAKTLKLNIAAGVELRGAALRIEDLAKRYDDKRLFEHLDLQVDVGDRLGITGPNGVGKTTLLNVLRGTVPADHGHFEFHAHADIGYYTQQTQRLTGGQTVLERIRAHDTGLSEQRARDLLARFQFRGNDVFKGVESLSGGEQSRVRLLELLLHSPNMLVLDEPTNHLDVGAREALEEALREFPGTLITVSHDRYFLDQVTNRLLVLRPAGHEVHHGNYSSYIAAREQAGRSVPASGNDKAARGASRPQTQASRPLRRTAEFDALSVEEIETRIMQREESIAELNERFGDPTVYQDAAALATLRSQLDAAHAELSILEEAWNERADNM